MRCTRSAGSFAKSCIFPSEPNHPRERKEYARAWFLAAQHRRKTKWWSATAPTKIATAFEEEQRKMKIQIRPGVASSYSKPSNVQASILETRDDASIIVKS
jgi:hypothetical protein